MACRFTIAVAFAISLLSVVPGNLHADGRPSRGGGIRAGGGRTNLPGGYLRLGRAPTNFPGYNRSFQAARSSSSLRYTNGIRGSLRGSRSRFRGGFFPGYFGVINRRGYLLPYSPGVSQFRTNDPDGFSASVNDMASSRNPSRAITWRSLRRTRFRR